MTAPPRILVVNCNTSQDVSDTINVSAQLSASPGARVETLTPTFGATSAEGYLDSQLTGMGMLRAVRDYEGRFDAVVLAGFGESGREAMRELVSVPVVDITDAAAQAALQLAPRYGVLTTLARAVVQIEDSLRTAGVATNCIGVRAANVPVLMTGEVSLAVDSPLVRQGRALLADGAEAIVLGCAGFAGLASRLSQHLGVPVIDPVAAGVAWADSLARLSLRTSKLRSYADPLPKARPGWDE